jgi:hypothetical protein
MINVKLFRIITGEEVIAELVSEEETHLTIKNGLVVIPTGQSVGFAPWASVIDRSSPELILSKNHIVYTAEVDSTIKTKYTQIFGGGIITPEEKKLIL